jgi:PmbA protein
MGAIDTDDRTEALSLAPIAARAGRALDLMRAQGFDDAQVVLTQARRNEVCVAHNEPSLLRSIESCRLQLVGLVDGRRAASEGSDVGDDGLRAAIADLWNAARAAPQDAANAVSSGQVATIVDAPSADADADADSNQAGFRTEQTADAMRELLAWRAAETPTMMIEEGFAADNEAVTQVLTSRGTSLAATQRWFDVSVFGLARDGDLNSSFNAAGGRCRSLSGLPVMGRFGIGAMMRSLTRETRPEPLGDRGPGAVVLTPSAFGDLVMWLVGQLGDQALIDGSSVYRTSVCSQVMSPLLSLRHVTDVPGVPPFSADGFAVQPVDVVRQGCLQHLLPTLYGSRRTGLAHRPVAADGWEVEAGMMSVEQLVASIPRGALVDRLSMGRPDANGDFSGVIKNSFAIRGGEAGHALAETMISGNVARMLRDIRGISADRIDTGSSRLPWVWIDGVSFS